MYQEFEVLKRRYSEGYLEYDWVEGGEYQRY